MPRCEEDQQQFSTQHQLWIHYKRSYSCAICKPNDPATDKPQQVITWWLSGEGS